MKSYFSKLQTLHGDVLHWLRREHDKSIAVRELDRLSDHLLRDIGIERGDIREIVSALYGASGHTVTRDVSALGRGASGEVTIESDSGALYRN